MQPQAPLVTEGDYDHLTYDELRNLRRRGGRAGCNSKAVLKTRLPTVGAIGRKRSNDVAGTMRTSETLSGNAVAPWLAP